MPVMEVHITPVGTGSPSMHQVVAQCVRVAKDGGVKVQVTPMGTAMEGNLDTLLKVAAQMHTVALEKGAPRVITSIRIDERKTGEVGLDGRVKEVEEGMKNI